MVRGQERGCERGLREGVRVQVLEIGGQGRMQERESREYGRVREREKCKKGEGIHESERGWCKKSATVQEKGWSM